MEARFVGKYYMLSIEKANDSVSDEEFQYVLDTIETMSMHTGENVHELNTLEFTGGDRIKVHIMGSSEEEGRFEVKEDEVHALDDDDYDIALFSIEGDTLTMITPLGKMRFGKTLPSQVEETTEYESGIITHKLNDITITLELPEKGWITELKDDSGSQVLHLYNALSRKKVGYVTPRIIIKNVARNLGKEKWTPIDNRIIAGLDMQGWYEEYDNIGYSEYVGKIGDYNLVSVLVQNLDINNGDVTAILGSIKIS